VRLTDPSSHVDEGYLGDALGNCIHRRTDHSPSSLWTLRSGLAGVARCRSAGACTGDFVSALNDDDISAAQRVCRGKVDFLHRKVEPVHAHAQGTEV